ncbi:MAG: hypothetical protein ACU85U_04820 [Gammaproteobacteria bacterium]
MRDGDTCATERVRQQAGPLAPMSPHNVMERQSTATSVPAALLSASPAPYDAAQVADVIVARIDPASLEKSPAGPWSPIMQ